MSSGSEVAEPASRSPAGVDVLAAVAAGGALGAVLRYGAGLALSSPASTFPWTTLLVNVVGCLLMGALMVTVTELTNPHRLLRPFLAVGVLGGFTTFSTYVIDVLLLITRDRPALAITYALVTVVGALLAVLVGVLGMRLLLGKVGAR